jgi:hypothetical protein
MIEEETSFVYRLERVRELLDGAYHTEDRAAQLACFAAASIIIQWLENSDARYDINFDSNRAQRLASIRMHFASMLGLDEMGDMTAAQHYENVLQTMADLMANHVGV